MPQNNLQKNALQNPILSIEDALNVIKASISEIEVLKKTNLTQLLQKNNPTHNNHVQFLSVSLAGTKFRKGIDLVKTTDKLYLEFEPDNPHDPNAIKVIHNNQHIGYIDRESALEIADSIENEFFLPPKVAYLASKKSGSWNDGTLMVRMENPIMAWEEYNPTISVAQNKALFEKSILSQLIEANLKQQPKKNKIKL